MVNVAEFAATEHGVLACVDCHGGTGAADKESAHQELVARPSDGQADSCRLCLKEENITFVNSLHSTQQGYWTILEARGADPHDPAMQEMFSNHCAGCHTTCGDCHVSQPASVGGGLFDGHLFTASPPMTRSCTACHGSRVGNEYMGKNEGLLADLHFRQARMTCTDCHDGAELHGQLVNDPEGAPPAHRYEGAEGPRCETCHEAAATRGDDIAMHLVHDDNTLACQVCHSVSYMSCDSCHVAVSETSGQPYFQTSASYMTFLIGRNPRQSEARPYDYVPLRHVPVDPESFAYYGDNLLPNFDAQQTWRYATPHNIQRETPQNRDCNACHGNAAIFLTADKVAPAEASANQGVIVEEVPPRR